MNVCALSGNQEMCSPGKRLGPGLGRLLLDSRQSSYPFLTLKCQVYGASWGFVVGLRPLGSQCPGAKKRWQRNPLLHSHTGVPEVRSTGGLREEQVATLLLCTTSQTKVFSLGNRQETSSLPFLTGPGGEESNKTKPPVTSPNWTLPGCLGKREESFPAAPPLPGPSKGQRGVERERGQVQVEHLYALSL